MNAGILPRLAAGALGLLVVASLATGLAASNTVPVTHAGSQTMAVKPNDLAPAECRAVIAVTSIRVGSGTITGNSSAELILGSAGADSINGGGGNDCVVAGGGNDTLSGGSGGGVDVLLGGPGGDTISGGNGNDWLYGGTGNDDLNGGNGQDHCYGGGEPGDSFTRCEISGP